MKIAYIKTTSRRKSSDTAYLQKMDIASNCDFAFVDSSTTPRASAALLDLIKSMKAGSTLIVWRLDIISNQLTELVEVASLLAEKNITLHTHEEGIDSKPLTFTEAVAKLSKFREAVKETHEAKGHRFGRATKLSEEQVREAYYMVNTQGKKKTDVAAHFGVSRPTLNASFKRFENRF